MSTVVKSPIVTGIASPPGLARSRATIASDRSMPCTSTPRAASGSATRPVPMASSSARPPSPARSARNPDSSARCSSLNRASVSSSYDAATGSPK